MKRLLFFLLLLWTAQAFGQDAMLTVTGRVVDAVTGEPLPYASVYMDKGKGTLTNIEGDFRLTASPQDILTFSFIGFEKMSMQAWEVPSRVRLKPYEQALREVEVRPVDKLGVLAKVIKNLKRDFSKHKKDRRGYFMRALMKNSRDSYLIESLMGWRSAVNLRDDETFSGVYGINAQGKMSRMGLTTTNISRMSEISPSAFQSAYWEKTVKPLYSLSIAKKYYNIAVETLTGEEDEKLYRLSFRWKGLKSKILEGRRYMTGDAFVDAKTM
ncbi:MAG: carboxypeptidase-like regulatory domain-containing protein, partial [Bacteroidaceae bacterium]|nr:carboxypeptidase-like regulatory domain-containing protein [Bacteroidaceae bacterium]